MKWICATTAPWALATGLLISFTASASNDLHSGVSFSPRSATARLIDTALVPPTGASIAGGRLGIERDILRSLPRYDLPEEAADSEPLKADRKADAGADAVVDRSAKGNPLVAPQATLSRRAKQLRPVLDQAGSARLLYSRDETLLPPTVLMEGELEASEMEQAFEPWQAPEYTTTQQATSVQSPAAAAAGSTGASASPTTPMVKRAVALSSTTPAPMDATPIEIAAAPVSLQSPRLDRGGGDMTILPKSDDEDRPRYADLIDPDNLSKEQRCLAEAVYFEARSEPRGRAGGGRPGGAEPREERALSVHHLRRGLPEPPPPSRLPVHLRLRRQGPAHPRYRILGAGEARGERRARRQDLSRRCGRRDALPRRLCQAPTGRAA